MINNTLEHVVKKASNIDRRIFTYPIFNSDQPLNLSVLLQHQINSKSSYFL